MAEITVRVEHGTASVYMPYSVERVAIVKSLPVRSWNKPEKCWQIPEFYIWDLRRKFEAAGDTVRVLTRREPGVRQEKTDTAWAETLLTRLSPEQADKAYKALSRVLHPDAGGDAELMQQLNRARDVLNGVNVRGR